METGAREEKVGKWQERRKHTGSGYGNSYFTLPRPSTAASGKCLYLCSYSYTLCTFLHMAREVIARENGTL